MTGRINQLRYRFSLRLFLAELLEKRWMEPALPTALLIGTFVFFYSTGSGFSNSSTLLDTLRELAEFALVCLAMSIPVISGGIDLSVGSMFGLSNIGVLILMQVVGLSAPLAILVMLAIGAVLGACNGVVVAYLKTNPFLTTLVTLIVFRSFTHILNLKFSTNVAPIPPENALWTWLGNGALLGIPSGFIVTILVFLGGHIILSRSRYGWHVTAIGANRRAARHAGIRVERVLFGSYVSSAVLTSLAGCLYASRLNNGSADAGTGLEFSVLTAVVVGGISLAGGKGTVARAFIGAAVISVLTKGLLLGGMSGSALNTVLAVVLILAVGGDVKWEKNRSKAIQKIYINPTLLPFGPIKDTSPGSGTAYEQNTRLGRAQPIGLGIIEGPEDVILDREGRLYCVDRRGWVNRFSGADFEHHEVFARIGGMPLGMAFDEDENLLVCVGGMGLYSVSPQGVVSKVTDETNRTWYHLKDDSRLRLADDLDTTPDGKIFFSEATVRFEAEEFSLDAIEGRPNGRLISYDPKTKKTKTVVKKIIFPNGVSSCHDRQSLLVASSWACKIYRYWHDGPKEGRFELFMDNLPGYPDNINRASDGNYWIAIFGMRSPCYDLAMRMPAFRRRMLKQVPPDEWLYPSMNHGCVLKVSPEGEIIESYWDAGGAAHSTITSMREHEGYMYIGGVFNNRVGRIQLPPSVERCHCGQRGCETDLLVPAAVGHDVKHDTFTGVVHLGDQAVETD